MYLSKWVAKNVALSLSVILLVKVAWVPVYELLSISKVFSSGVLSVRVDFITQILLIAVCLFIYLKQRNNVPNDIERWNLAKGFIATFVAIFTIIAAFLISYPIGLKVFKFFYPEMTSSTLSKMANEKTISEMVIHPMWTWVFPVILGPIKEEILFRGILLNVWRERLKGLAAITITAFLFMVSHYSNDLHTAKEYWELTIIFMPNIFITGIILGVIRTKFTINHSIIVHVSFNAIHNLLILS